MAELLLEFLTEEIPAGMQKPAAADLERLAKSVFSEHGISPSSLHAFTTPRRLVLLACGLPLATPGSEEERRGPRVDAPEPAIAGFLKSTGLATLDRCMQKDTDKGRFWFALLRREPVPMTIIASQLVSTVLAALPWPKSMRFAGQTQRWVRPLRQILVLFDGRAVEGGIVFGGTPYRFQAETVGHRVLAPGRLPVENFSDYQEKLLRGHVILDQETRRARLKRDLEKAAAAEGLIIADDPALLEEVNGLSEWPVVLRGAIAEEFLSLPKEVLIETMRHHQKFFALLKPDGALANRFLLVADNEAVDGGSAIIAGNERVLRARLSDARFFWDQDRKIPLKERLPQLEAIVFHAKLGNLAQRAARLAVLAEKLAPAVGADPTECGQAGRLAKADLVTAMVGEFPELQGIMGGHYAAAEGRPATVAGAIADQYRPLGPADACPRAPVAIALALADKIDVLTGFFAMEEKPTGSKDPYGLRRAALGIIRLILENDLRLRLHDVLAAAYSGYYALGETFDMAVPGRSHRPKKVIADILAFLADRLKVALKDQGVRHDLIAAVFALGNADDLVRLVARVRALQALMESAEGKTLLAAYKRATNIVRIEEKKDGRSYEEEIEPALLREPAEKQLHEAMSAAAQEAGPRLAREEFGEAMACFARIHGVVDAFFEKVTVNDANPALRANRLRLLAFLRGALGTIADFSKIEGTA
ncbi:MAG TPA: glycine--tRNA ligase subunit beta [Dongiaceae bacterium]|jgi:glycyl-tRNA synthetase beta chain|nr:glycine--tRNA ligase subunit beta [Dongiaceae bacterium]